jgi:endonuclease/exonuclease/phosphatase family metal-dependent hydrolase
MSSRKRKRPEEEEEEILPDRSNPSEVRILSANTCGFDKAKWENLKRIADSNDVDLIFMQECGSAKEVEDTVGNDWVVKVEQEKPAAAGIKDRDGKLYPVAPNCGVARFYATLKRRKRDKLQVNDEVLPYLPENSQAVKDFIFPKESESGAGSSTQGVRKSTRTKHVPAENLPNLRCLGERGPQRIEISRPGYMPVTVFNYHAPQGGGSGGKNQSGMDASKGHSILSCVVGEARTDCLVIGDQNVDKSLMQTYYPDKSLLSAPRPERLIHAAGSRALNLEAIDLGDDGKLFNNKGKPGCSDHSPLGLRIVLTKAPAQ